MNQPESVEPPIWRRHGTIAAAATVLVAVFAASCGGGSGGDTATDPASSGAGAELYQANCASCHGADLGGTDKGPSHLSIVYEPNHHGDDAFRSAIANGAQQHHWTFGDMAPIPGLSDDEVDEIIAFIRAEQERQGFDQ
ncbi:c-type cytochrome [Ilumatobacter nonamiensis]|uniref:c-type cytochrome n=1 Tax=Ilumatobacter nonamiensis TaxID=467093 RepID=UPI000683F9B5|nr:cytochrome c [Ilumatobacter nonamiensis]